MGTKHPKPKACSIRKFIKMLQLNLSTNDNNDTSHNNNMSHKMLYANKDDDTNTGMFYHYYLFTLTESYIIVNLQ